MLNTGCGELYHFGLVVSRAIGQTGAMISSTPALTLYSRRSALTLIGAAALSACSSYIPEGTTRPTGLSRAVITQKINDTRAANGRAPLTYSSRLERAAQNHTRLMASRGELSHTLGGTLRERVTAVDYVGAVGENLAGGQSTLEKAIEGWLNSPSHRNTLLSPNFVEFGLSVSQGNGDLGIYWAMILGGPFENWL